MGSRVQWSRMVDLNESQRLKAVALMQANADVVRYQRARQPRHRDGLVGALVLAAWMGLAWLALVLWS